MAYVFHIKNTRFNLFLFFIIILVVDVVVGMLFLIRISVQFVLVPGKFVTLTSIKLTKNQTS